MVVKRMSAKKALTSSSQKSQHCQSQQCEHQQHNPRSGMCRLPSKSHQNTELPSQRKTKYLPAQVYSLHGCHNFDYFCDLKYSLHQRKYNLNKKNFNLSLVLHNALLVTRLVEMIKALVSTAFQQCSDLKANNPFIGSCKVVAKIVSIQKILHRQLQNCVTVKMVVIVKNGNTNYYPGITVIISGLF